MWYRDNPDILQQRVDMINAYNAEHGTNIDPYRAIMINGDAAIAAKDAGFIPQGNKTLKSIGERVLKKDYIYDEILYHIDEMNAASIADEQEVMQYFTAVMRGEEKDQFGLDVSIADRTAAAKEIAKRIIDIPQKQADSSIQINLNWERNAVPALEG